MKQAPEVQPISFKATRGERQLLADLAAEMGAPSLSAALRVALRTAAVAHGLSAQEAPQVRGRRAHQKA